MSKQSVNLESITSLLEDLPEFDSMSSARQGAFRARVTRYMNQAKNEPEIMEILTAVQDKVGKASTKQSQTMTIEGVIAEYKADYQDYEPGQRAAFKAKVKRLQNRKERGQDIPAVNKLKKLLSDIQANEEMEERSRIMQMAKERGLL